MGTMTPGDLVEQLMAQTTVEGWIAYLHADAEYQPLPGAPVLRGLDEIREWAEREAADPDRPEVLPVSVTESAHTAVVRGQLRFVRGTTEKRHSVLEVAAWVVTVSDGRLRRVEAFSSWSAAEDSAGIVSDGSRRDRRLGRGFQLMLRLPPPRRVALRSG
jgi:ketosteroid isomerase-like protein